MEVHNQETDTPDGLQGILAWFYFGRVTPDFVHALRPTAPGQMSLGVASGLCRRRACKTDPLRDQGTSAKAKSLASMWLWLDPRAECSHGLRSPEQSQ